MRGLISIIIISLLFGCSKKNTTISDNNTAPIQKDSVEVIFSTQNPVGQVANYWYLYQINEQGDTIIKWDKSLSPVQPCPMPYYYPQIWHADNLPDGTNLGFARLKLLTETTYKFGADDVSGGFQNFKPTKDFVFHIKDTLYNGKISVYINY